MILVRIRAYTHAARRAACPRKPKIKPGPEQVSRTGTPMGPKNPPPKKKGKKQYSIVVKKTHTEENLKG